MNPEDIRWFRSRMLSRFFETIDDQERNRFDELVEENPICNGFWVAFRKEQAEKKLATHIPDVILDNWDAASRGLVKLEREIVGKHLASSIECRQRLIDAGFKPELSPDPAPAEQLAEQGRLGKLIDQGADAGKTLLKALGERLPSGFSIHPQLVPGPVLRGEQHHRIQIVDPNAPIVNLILAPIHWEDADELKVDVYLEEKLLASMVCSRKNYSQDFLVLNYVNVPPMEPGLYRFELIPLVAGEELKMDADCKIIEIQLRIIS